MHPSYSSQAQYQLLLTPYFMHTHKTNRVEQATSTSIIFIKNTISISTYELFYAHTQSKLGQTSHIKSIIFTKNTISTSTYELFYAHTQSKLGQTSHIKSIIFIKNTISTSTYRLFYTHTQGELGQTNHICIHHTHQKHNINF